MASRIKAIGAYRPKIQRGRTVKKQELIRYLAARTSLSEGQIDLAIKELRDAVIFFNQAGRGVRIEGLGTYSPKIDLEGTFGVQHRLDNRIKKGLNAPDTFTGQIVNRENIGKTSDELVALWNEEHPDDPVA